MILYNVTLSVDEDVHLKWLEYMQKEHIKDVLDTGCFQEARLTQVLGNEEQGGVTYSVQYLCKSQAIYDLYQEQFASRLQAEHNAKFAGKYAAFRTLLTVHDIFSA